MKVSAADPLPTALDRFQHHAQRIRVPSGFVLAALFLYFARPTPILLGGGLAVALLGVGMRAWASGHLRKNETLTVGGPYVLTRNPLYLGSLLIGIGCAAAGGNPWIGAAMVGFFLIVYLPVMRAEARFLTRLFPDAYPDYAARVPLLWPRLSALPEAFRDRFDAGLYLRYREYRALLGTLGVFVFLFGKMMWR